MKPVAILGCGPAGLMAAHAVAMSGKPVALFTQPGPDGTTLKSRLGGAQFLHQPIPIVNDVTKPDAEIVYRVYGNPDTYQRKVYGDDPTIPFVSMQYLEDRQVQPAWNLIATYDRLWDLLSASQANLIQINPRWLWQMLEEDAFEYVISSIPAPSLCMAHAGMRTDVQHTFVSQAAVISPECILDVPDNTVVYDGTTERSWYRCSTIFGHGGTEWSDQWANGSPYKNLVKVRKPIRTNCDCFEDLIIRVGRHGEWKKGVLTHHAFGKALEAVS